ncbi:hypothetical protein ACIQU6_05590 [Streptomyces sp. NPDC090442]|uniref:hypothetical protein n=1 Tax=Streptomyces sp. NPDC090442 TaxID=3365962 RepID=UPI00380B5461
MNIDDNVDGSVQQMEDEARDRSGRNPQSNDEAQRKPSQEQPQRKPSQPQRKPSQAQQQGQPNSDNLRIDIGDLS